MHSLNFMERQKQKALKVVEKMVTITNFLVTLIATTILEAADDGCLKINRSGVKRALVIVVAIATRKEQRNQAKELT